MIKWTIPKRLFAQAKIENPNQLAKAAGIGYPTAVRLMESEQEPVDKIEVSTLEALARVLNVTDVFSLLKHTRTPG